MPDHDDNAQENGEIEYYLIRVPKGIDPNELNGMKIDLATAEPQVTTTNGNIGYYCNNKTTQFNHATILKSSDDNPELVSIETESPPAGFISFYKA